MTQLSTGNGTISFFVENLKLDFSQIQLTDLSSRHGKVITKNILIYVPAHGVSKQNYNIMVKLSSFMLNLAISLDKCYDLILLLDQVGAAYSLYVWVFGQYSQSPQNKCLEWT